MPITNRGRLAIAAAAGLVVLSGAVLWRAGGTSATSTPPAVTAPEPAPFTITVPTASVPTPGPSPATQVTASHAAAVTPPQPQADLARAIQQAMAQQAAAAAAKTSPTPPAGLATGDAPASWQGMSPLEAAQVFQAATRSAQSPSDPADLSNPFASKP